ncbi:rCG54319 [Rattus norvegicus]|uniref:RCG54319 n=1 Tax=Rattus norvegicus TaxID=10116 RepID=A6JAF8_RAT|nr:rCG54319 [Rattus norvegicus]
MFCLKWEGLIVKEAIAQQHFCPWKFENSPQVRCHLSSHKNTENNGNKIKEN